MMHGLNIIRRLNDEEHQRVTQRAVEQAERDRNTQPQLSKTLAEYYAAKGVQYGRAGF